MKIELVYIQPQQEFIQELEIEAGSSVEQVIQQSDLFGQHPHLCLDTIDAGIFSTPVDLHTIVNEGDRIEVYRDLLMDPMQARRLRARV